MSQIIINDRIYAIYKTYEPALGVILCFIEHEPGKHHVMMLTPDGEWKFTGDSSASLKNLEGSISDAIIRLTDDYPICYS